MIVSKKCPDKVKNTLAHRCKLLEGGLGQIQLSKAAEPVGASVDNADNHAPGRTTPDCDTDLGATLGVLAPHGTHLRLVEGNDHVALRKTMSTGSHSVTEPSTSAAVTARVTFGRYRVIYLGVLSVLSVLIVLVEGFFMDLGVLDSLLDHQVIFTFVLDQLPVDCNAGQVSEFPESGLGKAQGVLLAAFARIDHL
ncbi:hypothetical protein B0O80DRAFT_102277 [Mortierella sp. GBAus27b]|nr:hypothetical protein B0O80DRAFT_102277 [Mortierella sp. GBAus27b]